MRLDTVDINGIKLDVYYTATIHHDPFATGDSPTEVEILIDSVTALDDVVDLQEMLSDEVLEEIEHKLIKIVLHDY